MTHKMKTLLMGLGIFLVVVAGIFVVYTLRKPSTDTLKPAATPLATVRPSAVVPPVNVVAPQDVCELSFAVVPELVPGLNCQAKELYKDVAANTAGIYTLTGNKLAADFQMVPGETYIYVISYKNTGTGATDGKIEDTLPTGITYKDSEEGCTYASSSRKVTCTLPSVAAGATGQRSIRFTVNASSTVDQVTNTAKVIPTVGDVSTCRLTNPLVTPTPSPSPIPSPSPSPIVSPSPVPSKSPSPTPTPSVPPSALLDCIVKRAYENAPNNTAGQYYLNNEIIDTNTLQNGQTIVFNVLIGNKGGAAVPDATITDVLSSNLTYLDGESGCSYDSATRTVTCTVGSLAGNTEVSRSFRAKVNVAGTSAIANTADVFSTNGQRDSCSITINATGQVVQPPSPVPSALPEAGVFEVTAGTLGVGLILLLLGALGLLLI